MRNLKEETIRAVEHIGKNIVDIRHSSIARLEFEHYEFETIYKGKALDLEALDFSYDEGYGTQEISGFIVFLDNSWLSRQEYDGSEWWEYHTCPELEQ